MAQQLKTAACLLRNRRLCASAPAVAAATLANTTQIEFEAGRLPEEHPQTEFGNSQTSKSLVCTNSLSITNLIARGKSIFALLPSGTAELARKISGTLFCEVQNNPDLQVSVGMYVQVCELVI